VRGRTPVHALLVAGALLLATLWLSRGWLFDATPWFPERDSGFSAIVLDHLRGALVGGPDWRAAPLAWPSPIGTTNADWMLGQALLTLPLDLAGVDPSATYEWASFLGLLLTAWAGAAFARALAGPGVHTLLAGLVIGLGPLQLAHAQHANLVHHELVLLGPLLLGAGLASDRRWLALAGGAALAGAQHFGLYMGLHGLLAGVGVLVWGLATRRAFRATWGAAAVGFAGVGLTLLPVVALYGAASGGTSVPRDEMVQGSWDVAAWFGFTRDAPLHAALASALPFRAIVSEFSPNPGFLVTLLALVGLGSLGRPRGAWVGVLGVGAVAAALALGPQPHIAASDLGIPGPHRVLEALSGSNLREPRRWLWLTHAAVALYASVGFAALLARLPSAARPLVASVVMVIALAELPDRPVAAEPEAPNSGLCLLDTVSAPGPLFDVFRPQCNCSGTMRLRAALFHGRPLVGGTFARFTQEQKAINQLLASWPSPGARLFAELVEVKVVLEHPPIRKRPPPGTTCQDAANHRVCELPGRGPIPAPAAVTERVSGPVLGVRWAAAPSEGEVRIACDGAAETTPVDAWRAFALVRGVATFDAFFSEPCAGMWEATPEGGVPLYRDPGAPIDWLPPTRDPEPVAPMFTDGCDAIVEWVKREGR
jgi:hypothetical protein